MKLLKASELGSVGQRVDSHNRFLECLSLFHAGFCMDFTSVAPLLRPACSQCAGHWGHGLDAFFCSAGQRVMLTSCSRKATLCLSFWGAAEPDKTKKSNTYKFKRNGKDPRIIPGEGACASSPVRARSFLLVDHLPEHPETIKWHGTRNTICKSACW